MIHTVIAELRQKTCQVYARFFLLLAFVIPSFTVDCGKTLGRLLAGLDLCLCDGVYLIAYT